MDKELSMTDDDISSNDSDVSTHVKMGQKVSEGVGLNVSTQGGKRHIVSKKRLDLVWVLIFPYNETREK